MLTKMAQWLTAYVVSDSQDEEQRAVCEYGCELWLYTIISTIGLLIIGVVFGSAIEAGVMITIFYLCQSCGGGYHANTHTKCFVTMAVGLIFGLTMLGLPMSSVPYILILISSMIVLLIFPLQLHPNKQYLVGQSRKLSKRSRIVTIGIVLTIAVMEFFVPRGIIHSGCVAMMMSAISRVSMVIVRMRTKTSKM